MNRLSHLIRGGAIVGVLTLLGPGGLVPVPAEDKPQKQHKASEHEEPAAPANASDAVVRWLDKLEQRGRAIQSLQANVLYEKHNKLLGDRQFRTGTILYHDAKPGPKREPRFAVHFEQLIVNNARREQRVDYIFDGTWLVEKNHERKLFMKRQVVPPGRTFDPLQIDGPFPVPIGQQREAVLRRFNVEIIDPPEQVDSLPQKDLAKPPLHLRLTPREDAPNAGGDQRFKQVDMWFNRETLLPLRVRTVNDQQATTTVTLSDIRTNQLEDAELEQQFDTTAPERGWRVEVTPWQDVKQQ